MERVLQYNGHFERELSIKPREIKIIWCGRFQSQPWKREQANYEEQKKNETLCELFSTSLSMYFFFIKCALS